MRRLLVAGWMLALMAFLPMAPAWAEGTFRLVRIEGAHVKWGAPEKGVGAVVGYALVAEPRSFPGARNCGEMAPLNRLAAAAGLSLPEIEAELEAALAMWASAADIAFERRDGPENAEILIGVDAAARGFAWANLAVGQDEGGIRPIRRALVCLNPERPWTTGREGLDLRSVLAHEIGHAIGLNHPSARDQVMSFSFESRFEALQPGDVQGVRLLYGLPPRAPLARLGPPPRILPAATGSHDGPAGLRWVSR